MSDTPKTIQEALAEVQRKINEQRATRVADIIDEASMTLPKLRTPAPTKTSVPTASQNPVDTTLKSTGYGPATEIGKAAKVVTGTPTEVKPIATSSSPTTASTGRSGVGMNKVMNRSAPSTTASPTPKTTPAPTKSTAAPIAKSSDTPAAPKQTFGQAFAAARKSAEEKGSKSTGQFDYEGKKYQTNIKGEKYVPVNKQTKIYSPAPTTTASTPDASKDSTTTASQTPTPKQSTGDSYVNREPGWRDTPPQPARPSLVGEPPASKTPIKDFVRDTISGKVETPIMDKIKGKTPEERESGGKKKMSEENNPLIAAVLRLQEKNTVDKNLNMFSEAKKAKKDYDGDGKIESEKDEVWGSRFAAAKKAGKMEEGNIDPVVTGSKTVTTTPKGYVDPSTPTQPYTKAPMSTAAGDVLDKAKNALDKTGVKEEAEVTFSQEEIDHINSFFLEASIAPNRPEVATGADSTSDKMSQNDVTGTAESGGKKKIKEEVEIDEISSDLATSYAKKASKHLGKLNTKMEREYKSHADIRSSDEEKPVGQTKSYDKMWHKAGTRGTGIDRALARGAKLKEETLEEGRPKKNPTPETTERDPRKHIQVEAGRAAAGNVVDFHHNDGSKSKITPAMGRRITSHLNSLKPADRQSAVNKMHDSAEGLKV
jgi:hypothetical protein